MRFSNGVFGTLKVKNLIPHLPEGVRAAREASDSCPPTHVSVSKYIATVCPHHLSPGPC